MSLIKYIDSKSLHVAVILSLWTTVFFLVYCTHLSFFLADQNLSWNEFFSPAPILAYWRTRIGLTLLLFTAVPPIVGFGSLWIVSKIIRQKEKEEYNIWIKPIGSANDHLRDAADHG